MARPDVAFELARDQLGYQLASADTIQATTGMLYAVSVTLAGIMVAIVALKPQLPHWTWFPGTGLVAVYVWLTVAMLSRWRGTEWKLGPQIEAYAGGAAADEDAAMWQVVVTVLDARDSNRKPYGDRLWLLRAAVVALAIETALLLAVAVAALSAP